MLRIDQLFISFFMIYWVGAAWLKVCGSLNQLQDDYLAVLHLEIVGGLQTQNCLAEATNKFVLKFNPTILFNKYTI